MKLRAVIVDDEPTARRTLQSLVQSYATDVEVVAMANDVLSAVKAINKTNPDLVFLDVQMPNYSGFSLVEYFDELQFKIIFTTAYEEYAQQAFTKGASGYLLKPIDIDDLNKAVENIREIFKKEQFDFDVKDNKATNLNLKSQILTLPSVGGILKLNLEEILYFEAKGRQVMIYLNDNNSLIANISLKSIQEVLTRTTFIRIQKSYVVNFMHLKRYTKGKEASITLYNDITLEVGKVYKDRIRQVINYLPK